MPTVTANTAGTRAAIEYIQSYLAQRGMHCTLYEYSERTALTACTGTKERKKPLVQLSAHIDVVPYRDSQLTLQEKDGKLYGRGVYDMKFAIAGFMELVDMLHEEGTLHEYDFGIAITPDEEASTQISGVEHLIQEGYRPSVAILPDSTAPGWDIEKVAKGRWCFELISVGKTTHASRPWEGESASTKLVAALHELATHYKDGGRATDTLNIGSINGGGGIYNSVPDQMVANVEIRLSNAESYPKATKLVRELCEKHNVTSADFFLAEPAWPITDDPLVQEYCQSVKKITGRMPEGVTSLGGSDANFYTSVGIPCILSCPKGGDHHSGTEWVDKTSLEQFVPILRDYLDKVARKV